MHRHEIVLPTHDNDGVSLDAAHAALRRNIAKTGGFQRYTIRGYWPDPDTGRAYHEECIVYTFDSPEPLGPRLTAIAVIAKAMARQEAIYVCDYPINARTI